MTTREALKELRDNLAIHVIAAPMFGGDHCEINVMEVKAMIEEADAALNEPLRNCDVGTAEEQTARYKTLCRTQKNCNSKCPVMEWRGTSFANCEIAWAQMPYEEEGAGK
ncbi:MAG: hypothetical protein J6Q22_11060 [Prevotella sp.]|nr:hypothetical protein [Prevotella sp.]